MGAYNNQVVLFVRENKWHVGWILTDREDPQPENAESNHRVAWIEGGRMYSKVVDRVYPTDIPLIVAQRPSLV